MILMTSSDLPLTRIARGKVRDIYAVDEDRLLLVATDRVSAFDVVMAEAIPMKGAVLTQISAWWFRQLGRRSCHHMLSADADEIVAAVPALETASSRHRRPRHAVPARRRSFRSNASSAAIFPARRGRNTRSQGTLAGEKLPPGLRESERLEPPIFSPATKAESGHDENITIARMREVLGAEVAARARAA